MLPQLFEQTPELAERCQQFTVDRDLECSQLKATLHDEYEIRPLIDCKMMWRQEKQGQNYDPKVPITRLLNDGVRTDNIVYDERGRVYCVCPETQEQREIVFCGFEKD